jgi:hypothetical protein
MGEASWAKVRPKGTPRSDFVQQMGGFGPTCYTLSARFRQSRLNRRSGSQRDFAPHGKVQQFGT